VTGITEGNARDGLLRAGALAAVAGGAYVGCLWLAPRLRLPAPALALLLSLILFTALPLALTAAVTGLRLTWISLLVGFAVCAGAWAATRVWSPRSPLADLSLILAAIFFGLNVARLVREPNLLLPVLATAAVVDLWGVYYGPVAKVVQRAPEVVEQVTARAPVFRPAAGGTPLTPLVGVGDFIFLAILLGCVYRCGMNVRGTLGLTAAFTFLGLLGVSLLNVRLPGLVFMGLAGILANRQYFRFSREEKFALLYASAALLGVLGLLWWLWRG
jgi:hypothetical protein